MLDTDISDWMLLPTPYQLERRAQKRERLNYILKEALAAFCLFALIALTIILGVLLQIPEPIAHAQEAPEIVPVETFTAVVTAYSSSVDETDSTPYDMASGRKVYAGAIACPKKYAFGTQVRIEGKTYTCEDRMAKKFADRFDIWKESKVAAWEHGTRKVEVAILP